jgi:nicotinic acid mononucleotide adenylyltransferase
MPNNKENSTKIKADEKNTPIDKLVKEMSLLENSSERVEYVVVLLGTGAANPPHRQHIENFELVKKAIESSLSTFKVVAGYFSPSQDLYLRKLKKLGDQAIPENDRIEMSKLSVKDSEWIDISTWEIESSKTNFTDYSEVMNELFNFLNNNNKIKEKLLKYSKLVIAYVCGSDWVMRTGAEGINLGDQHLIAAVERSTKDNEGNVLADEDWKIKCKEALKSKHEGDWRKSVIFIENKSEFEISSTKVREIIKGNKGQSEKLKELLSNYLNLKVLEYIINNNILQSKYEVNIVES